MPDPLRTFESLTPNFRSKLINLLEVKYTFKGSRHPRKRAREFIARKKPKSYEQWQTIVYMTMLSIDRQRVKLGLAPIHFSGVSQHEPSAR
jgi:hypothetical protein